MYGDISIEIAHFARCLLEDLPFEVDLQTPVDAVRIIEAGFESAKSGQPVKIYYQ